MKPRHLAVLLSMFAATAAGAESYTIDSRHTFPVFEVSHYGFSLQRGRFNKLAGKLELDPGAKRGSVEITIDMTSVDMGFEDWNKQMRGERFFQTDKFPQARFVARDFAFDADQPAPIGGELTLLGVTRSVQLKVGQWRCAKHPILPRQLCGADLETAIKRSDFGMTANLPGIADDVRITIPVEALKDS
ncbi:YceI family protein [Sulfuritalea sp.]|uniref:YceI family protein n=1 Tax=Sulfuritalea sp. TaxID=2480090 RepID=UPI00286DD6DD|nr:YceI family protein [Sulfuritalea sp.]